MNNKTTSLKRLSLLVFLCFCSFLGVGQKVETQFQINNGNVIWQKIYETDLSFEEFVQQFKKSGVLSEIEITESGISGDIKRRPFDFRAAGYKSSQVAMSVISNDITGFAIIEYKDGRYRVTAKNLKMVQKTATPLGERNEMRELELYAIKKGVIRNSFYNYHQAEVMDFTLQRAFELNSISNDW